MSGSDSEAGVSCVQCGAPLPPDAQFCGACGAAQTRTCPTCGASSDRNDTFCAQCGTELDDAGARTGVQQSTVASSSTRHLRLRSRKKVAILLAGLAVFATVGAGAYFVLSERGMPPGDATAGADLRWTRMADANLGEGSMVSVAWDGSSFVAIGSGAWPSSSAWTSSDGIAWSRVPDAALNFGYQEKAELT